jgi:hypothetical protein
MMLSPLLLIPFLGALGLALWPGNPTPEQVRRGALVVLGLQLAWSLWVLAGFDPALSGMQMGESLDWVQSLGLNYRLGVDGLSMPLLLVNAGLTFVSAFASGSVSQKPKLYFALLLVISGAVNGAFLAQNLLLFFLFYELELIPLWLLISVWGGANRAYAATKFLIFTAVSGMLILGAFLGLALVTGQVDFSLTPVLSQQLGMGTQLILMGALLIGFGIKIPLFPFHTWLPDAHGEANAPVSMLLAGVLLKMGGFEKGMDQAARAADRRSREIKSAFSGKHDNSVIGVANKDYDAAAIANSVMVRMVERKAVDGAKLRSIYKSQTFPTTGYGHAYNLKPELAAKVREAFFTFNWEGTALLKEFEKSNPPQQK